MLEEQVSIQQIIEKKIWSILGHICHNNVKLYTFEKSLGCLHHLFRNSCLPAHCFNDNLRHI